MKVTVIVIGALGIVSKSLEWRLEELEIVLVWILGIPTFVSYLMPKPSFYKNSSGSILPIAWR